MQQHLHLQGVGPGCLLRGKHPCLGCLRWRSVSGLQPIPWTSHGRPLHGSLFWQSGGCICGSYLITYNTIYIDSVPTHSRRFSCTPISSIMVRSTYYLHAVRVCGAILPYCKQIIWDAVKFERCHIELFCLRGGACICRLITDCGSCSCVGFLWEFFGCVLGAGHGCKVS